MAGPKEGHAPTFGPGNVLYLLGQGKCPECRGELRSAGNSSYACTRCGATYPVAGGVP